MRLFLRHVTLAIVLMVAPLLAAQADPLGGGNSFLPVEEAYKVSFTADGNTLTASWLIAEGYYLYGHKFKLSAYIDNEFTDLDYDIPSGKVHFDEYLEKEVEVYYHSSELAANMANLPEQFILKIQSQGCADAGLCYAPRTQYFDINRNFGTAVETDKSAVQPPGGTPDAGGETTQSQPAPAKFTFGVYLLLAIGGGLILNLMPCVFPVLSLKALTFAASAGSPHTHHLHGWAYTAGVIGSFLVAAVLILLAKTAGEQTGWGFQLQYPPFVAAIAYLFLFMGLSLSGLVHIGTSFMGIGQGLTTQEGYRGSFFTGILAALVASPCTGPMMAPALGFALTQPPLWALSIFIALGFGMALPFLLLSYSPKLAQLLPRPGAWMERLKELLAFPMYLTAIWLLFVYGRQVGMHGVAYLLCGAVALVFAIWVFKFLPERKPWRTVMQASGLAAIALAVTTVVNSEDYRDSDLSDVWQPFSESLVSELRENGQPVFVDFTADWCITCKANERIALSRDEFFSTVEKYNVALVKGDWTREDPEISKVLEQFNRSGVPLYLVYSSDLNQAPEVLPQLLTPSLVVEALQRAAGDHAVVKQP